jgi:hypothetical protein
MEFPVEQIQTMIYVIRGQKVMLDSDLALLYGVETKSLNRQVRRNIMRFPEDFMFQLTKEENESLKCQNGTSKVGRGGKQKQPLVFTENGVAMLSGILNSQRAINVNIAIMRIFSKLRAFHLLEKELINRIDEVELNTNSIFKIVFERLDRLDNSNKNIVYSKRKIGLKYDD